MEDNDDSDAKLREEIEAELDKISISSLENDEVENDSESETESDNSDTVSVSQFFFMFISSLRISYFVLYNVFILFYNFSSKIHPLPFRLTYMFFILNPKWKIGAVLIFLDVYPSTWYRMIHQTRAMIFEKLPLLSQ